MASGTTARDSRACAGLNRARAWLPRGGTLDDASWVARHRGICAVLWMHVIALPATTLVRGETLGHALPEVAGIAWLALAAELRGLGIRLRSAAATLGLMACSAAVVHVFDGTIEAHFHFFVMVAVVALYQSWVPFLLALAFVVVHHGVIGTLEPEAVYNHAAAIERPWLWGIIHGAFIFAESIACLVYWRASELAVERERRIRVSAEEARQDLALAQELAGMGSWEWDARSGSIRWSEHLYVLAGVDPSDFEPTPTSFQELVHPEDREQVQLRIMTAVRTGELLEYECRILRADGDLRTVHALGHATTDDSGAVVHIRGTVHDVTERRRLEEAITQMAFHDPLTGLCNRRLYLERLEEALARSALEGGTCAVLFIDLDGFKAVNDRHGHAAGDALLLEIAARLRSAVRDTDTVARFGGDEFAVLCEGGDSRAATRTAQRIESELRRPAVVDQTEVVIAASIGIAVADPESTSDGLLRQADAAMYAAKTSSGRRHPPPPRA